MVLEDGKIRGRKVIAADGRHIGDVEGFEIDTETWRVAWFQVKLQREALEALKLRKPLFGAPTVRVGPDRIKTITDTVLLHIDSTEVSALLRPDSSL